MRILYLAPAGGLGGAERVLLDVLHGVRGDVVAGVLVFSDGPLITEVRSLGIPVWVVPLPAAVARLGEQSGSSWALLMQIMMSLEQAALPGYDFIVQCRRVVEEFRPDVVHSNGLKAHLLARLMCGGRPLVLHVHDFYAQRALTRHLLGRVVGAPVTLLAISKATAEDVAELLPRAPIEIVYNAVDTHYFSPGEGDPAWLDALAGMPRHTGTPLRVGLVATYARWKGHDVFLRAAALLASWGHAAHFRFYIVGSAIYSTSGSQCTRAELERRSIELGIVGNVGFVDFQEDIARVYRSLSVVVHASTGAEPFGRTIIEGMACAKPVLSTATGGAAELFEPGVSGLRIVPGSAGSLAGSLLQLKGDVDLQARLSDQARKTVLARFDRARLASQMLDVYGRALQGRRRANASGGARSKALSEPRRGDRLRILFVSPVGILGGAERSLLDMLRALRAQHHKFDLRLMMLEEGPLQSRARALGVDVEVLPLPAPLREMGEASLSLRGMARLFWGRATLVTEGVTFARRFQSSVARVQPDLVHTNGMKAHMLAGALSRDVPSVLHVRDFVAERPFSRRMLTLLQRPRLMVVANSHAVARETVAQMPKVKVRTIYNGIDLAHFAPGPGERAWLAHLSGLPAPATGCVCFGMVATYARWKGQALFLEAAARVVAEDPAASVRFYVVGGPVYSTDGSQFDEGELLALRQKYGLEEQVGFVPFQDDVAPIYRSLDVLVNPSTQPEPFGRSIVEAMAARCPVIVANNGGALELFVDGVTALGFETGNAAALADKMLCLAGSTELRARLASAAHEQASERFALLRLGAEISDAYTEVLGMRQGGTPNLPVRRIRKVSAAL